MSTSTATFWCEYAWPGGDGDASDAVLADVVITVADGHIEAIDSGPPPPSAVELKGITIPGLVNAHSHAFHRALRSRTQIHRGTFWTWREQMYAVAERLTPDNYRALATAVFAEMLTTGITTVGEFHYVHHRPDGQVYDDPNAMTAAVVDAATEAGIRITVLDTCYLHAGIGADGSPHPPVGVQARFSDGDAGGWAARATDAVERFTDQTTRVGAAVHSVRAVDPAAIETVARWADAHDAVLHAHVSEQPAENKQCLAAYAMTPLELLDHHGAIGPRFTAVHATHLSNADIERLGAADAGFCMCPTTERDLADGVGPAVELIAAGAAMSLGSDSHAVIDLFEEARAVEMDERLRTQVRGHLPAEALLASATSGGSRQLGWDDGGVLAPGSLADFVTIGLDSVRLAGTRRDEMIEAIVFAASAADVTDVVVGGKVVVANGGHVSIDVPAALAESIRAVT